MPPVNRRVPVWGGGGGGRRARGACAPPTIGKSSPRRLGQDGQDVAEQLVSLALRPASSGFCPWILSEVEGKGAPKRPPCASAAQNGDVKGKRFVVSFFLSFAYVRRIVVDDCWNAKLGLPEELVPMAAEGGTRVTSPGYV
jgi:hypothetical protein